MGKVLIWTFSPRYMPSSFVFACLELTAPSFSYALRGKAQNGQS